MTQGNLWYNSNAHFQYSLSSLILLVMLKLYALWFWVASYISGIASHINSNPWRRCICHESEKKAHGCFARQVEKRSYDGIYTRGDRRATMIVRKKVKESSIINSLETVTENYHWILLAMLLSSFREQKCPWLRGDRSILSITTYELLLILRRSYNPTMNISIQWW